MLNNDQKNRQPVYNYLLQNNLNIGDRSSSLVHDLNFELILGLRKKNLIFNPNYQVKTITYLFQYIQEVQKNKLHILVLDFNLLLEDNIDLSEAGITVVQEWLPGGLSNGWELCGPFSSLNGDSLENVGLIINITNAISETILNEFKAYNIPVADLSDGKWLTSDTRYTLLFPVYTWAINFFFDLLLKYKILTYYPAPFKKFNMLVSSRLQNLKIKKIKTITNRWLKKDRYFKQLKQFKTIQIKNLAHMFLKKKKVLKSLFALKQKNLSYYWNSGQEGSVLKIHNNYINKKFYLPKENLFISKVTLKSASTSLNKRNSTVQLPDRVKKMDIVKTNRVFFMRQFKNKLAQNKVRLYYQLLLKKNNVRTQKPVYLNCNLFKYVRALKNTGPKKVTCYLKSSEFKNSLFLLVNHFFKKNHKPIKPNLAATGLKNLKKNTHILHRIKNLETNYLKQIKPIRFKFLTYYTLSLKNRHMWYRKTKGFLKKTKKNKTRI